jgi:hypothetical protein
MTMGIAKITGILPIAAGALGLRTLFAATAALVLIVVACEGDRTRIDAEAIAPPALVELTLRSVRRCPHCGWIESKREVAPLSADARAPASYEYTARMRDGSSHVFREEMPASWRLGERLLFIEGSDPLNR